MSNMSYCRFENTLPDLRDCYENMDDDDLSLRESKARLNLIKVCQDIAYDYGYETDEHDPTDQGAFEPDNSSIPSARERQLMEKDKL